MAHILSIRRKKEYVVAHNKHIDSYSEHPSARITIGRDYLHTRISSLLQCLLMGDVWSMPNIHYRLLRSDDTLATPVALSRSQLHRATSVDTLPHHH